MGFAPAGISVTGFRPEVNMKTPLSGDLEAGAMVASIDVSEIGSPVRATRLAGCALAEIRRAGLSPWMSAPDSSGLCVPSFLLPSSLLP